MKMQKDNSIPTHPLEIYFRHNLWSNLRLFDACRELPEEHLDYSSKGSYGSIRSTLRHISSSEEYYIFHIASGKQAAYLERPGEETPLSELRTRVGASGETLLELATTLDVSTLINVGTGEEAFLISIEALLLQVIHHAHEHRTQIESMLGQLGIDPPGLSGWRYYDEEIKG
jgi:uncharacterized damage-inducible protein DinB